MPRGALLEYMLARVTKNCPDFFEKYVTFQTNVTNVVFDEDDGMFHISTRSFVTGKSQMRLFDRCIWAAGDNGKPNMPGSVLRTLEGFSGKVIHSTETATLKDDVCGKRVLIVGGSYSAEDLALMACKLQVEQIYICFRSENGESPVTWTGAWPNDKVEILSEKTPVSVENGSTVVLQKTENVQDDVYQLEEGGEQTRLENIDTVILCTGYHQQYDMLEDKLKNWVKVEKTATYPTPSDWKMDENILTPLVGEVEAPEEFRYYWTSIAHRDLYRGLLIDNPKMMFLLEERDDYPILNIDVMAWMFLRFVTGGSEIPSAEEMRKRNIEQCLFEMKTSPLARFHCDLAYGEAYEEAAELRDPEWELFEQILWNDTLLEFKIMARIMQEADYPLKIGTSDELNEKGKQLYEYAQLDSAHRENATSTTTFRDAEEAHKFTSIFTGTAAISLKKPWLEIDENVDEDLV